MIYVTITAGRGEGKSWAAKIIAAALQKYGAEVSVRDEDLTPSDEAKRNLRLARRDSVLAGKQVQVDTYNEPGTAA